MKKSNRWSSPGWPWELELLALIFVIIAIVVPAYLEHMRPTESTQTISLIAKAQIENQKDANTWQHLQGFFWALALVGLYIAHLIISGASGESISTPFTYLFSPLAFAMITYYRLYEITKSASTDARIVNGNPVEIAAWIFGVLIVTFLVARIRMARHMLRFRSVDWDLVSPTLFDSTYFELLAHFQPLVYPPRLYRVCPEGILVEGWFYVMPISFDAIQSVDATHGSAMMSAGFYLATSSKSLIRIRTANRTEPILISPTNRAEFLHYCEQQMIEHKGPHHTPETKSGGTSGGTPRAKA